MASAEGDWRTLLDVYGTVVGPILVRANADGYFCTKLTRLQSRMAVQMLIAGPESTGFHKKVRSVCSSSDVRFSWFTVSITIVLSGTGTESSDGPARISSKGNFPGASINFVRMVGYPTIAASEAMASRLFRLIGMKPSVLGLQAVTSVRAPSAFAPPDIAGDCAR